MAGYTDICADPAGVDPGDPTMHSYGSIHGIESLEPGNHSRGTPAASGWGAWLEEKGYDEIPESIFIGDPTDTYSTGGYPNALVEGMVKHPEQYTPVNDQPAPSGFSTLVDAEGFAAPAFHAAEHCESA